ncbi:hypothetical protein NB640_06325 [Oxalobacter vibrioformis]|uniref:Uncharacterized protein n=1 Tax=Oxalobacter vibrioformis TaxID=933080 RepID=A0A9E9LXU1_9BURK|nr:hypothetical protein [Oxalobacter vibrioformis]WAW11241.1 hypothetical protein NB640_06325 [Oxalobacter vibrioformis]
MSEGKKLPPRKAYSLKDAAHELGCSIEALLDWGNQGIVKICMKLSKKTRMSLIDRHKTEYERYCEDYNIQHNTMPDISKHTATVSMTTSMFNWGNNYNGDAFIMLHPYWEDTIRKKVFNKSKGEYDIDKKVSARAPAIILGFWAIQRGHFYDFDVDGDNDLDSIFHAYGGDAEAVARVMLTLDDLFLMGPEFEKLRNYKPGNEKTTGEKLEESINEYAVPTQRMPMQEERILSLLRQLKYDPQNLPQKPPGKPGVRAEILELAMKEKKIFTSKTAVYKAWQRLRDKNEIR